MATERTYTPSSPREECQNSPETVATLDTQITKVTAKETMAVEQEVDQSEGMTVDEYGPFNNTEDTREIRGEQVTITTISSALSTETDGAMEEHEKQHKVSKVRTGSPPSPTPDDETTPFLPTTNPKRNKKLRVERDTTLPRERTRSKARQIIPQRP